MIPQKPDRSSPGMMLGKMPQKDLSGFSIKKDRKC
jgi:hypothetical protein